MEINKILQTGREALLKTGKDPREARLLLSFILGIRSEELVKYDECSEENAKKYLEALERRCKGEPYAYIVGNKEFMKLNFKVDKNVLIPREDTEVLVTEVINLAKKIHNSDNIYKSNNIKILDMCTGSGCIAISLAKYIEDSKVTAVDISEEALKIAKINANSNDVEVRFINSNLFNVLSKDEKFDIIVSNPPYIKKAVIEELQEEVKKEPVLALDGGVSGLEFYEKIINQAIDYLSDNGFLAFEIGYDQGEAVSNLMRKNGYKNVLIVKDLSENDRVVIGCLMS
ncbi:MAG: peptide chain release factor N(5)-glutamine methyltransferase [Clostridia bacterium]|nr:peptide chain release factor N(5)-glutamine methyltransferase [Clostridia bacterium]